MNIMNHTIPKTIFIVPYKNRPTQKNAFLEYFNKLIIENENLNKENTQLFFINQQDDRLFNRGAIKNIGFIVVKNLYPEHYKNITLIYHDIDTFPKDSTLLDYKTKENIIKHYYGYTFTLGGILAIKASDFEKIKGFSNFWGWGYEDNVLNERAILNNIKIDRTINFKPLDVNIIRLNDENTKHISNNKIISRRELSMYANKEPLDNLTDIKNLKYEHTNISDNINEYNVTNFNTNRMYSRDEIIYIDVSKQSLRKFTRGWFRQNWNMRNFMR